MESRWCLQKDDATNNISVLIDGKPVEEFLQESGELKDICTVGYVQDIQAVSAVEVKITFSEKLQNKHIELQRNVQKFSHTTLFSATHFKDCTVAADFVRNYLKITSYKEEAVAAEQSKEIATRFPLGTPEKSVESSANTIQQHSETPENKRIDKKRIGKFKIPIQFLHSPDKKRRVREMDDTFVKQIQKEMLSSAELSTAAAAPLLGFIDVEKENFSEEKLRKGEYKVETIDGNHSLHAMRNLKEDERFTQRAVVIYGNITEEQCLKLGINRNKETSMSLKMTDYDYMVLLREQLLNLTETQEPEETVPPEFTRIMCNIMDLKTKAEIDSKGTIRFLVTKLTKEQFTTVCDLFKRSNKKIPMSRFRPLQGLSKDKIDELLGNLSRTDLAKKDWDELKQKSDSEKDKKKGNALTLIFKNSQVQVKKGDKILEGDCIYVLKGSKKVEIKADALHKLLSLDEKTIDPARQLPGSKAAGGKKNQPAQKDPKPIRSGKGGIQKKCSGQAKSGIPTSASANTCDVSITGSGQANSGIQTSTSANASDVSKTDCKIGTHKKSSGPAKSKIQQSTPASTCDVSNTAIKEKECFQTDDVYAFDPEKLLEKTDYVEAHPETITKGQFIAVKSAKNLLPLEPYPWIAQVVSPKQGKNVLVKWWMGDYYTIWQENPSFKDCKPDTVKRNLVLAVLNWDIRKEMPPELVAKLKKMYGEGPDEEEDE